MLDTTYASLKYTAISGDDLNQRFGSGDLASSEQWYSFQYDFVVFTFDGNNSFIQSRWEQLYDGIFRSNKVLARIEASPDSIPDSYKPALIAQAKFLRGLYYFWIANDFGKGIITSATVSQDENFSGTLKSKTQLEDEAILPDLKYAYEHIAEFHDKQINRSYATKGAATAMLGKVYLYREEWSQAAAYFHELIADPSYQLVSNPLDNFSDENEYNPESVLEVDFTQGAVNHNRNLSHPQLEYSTRMGQIMANLHMGGYNAIMPSYTLHELFLSDSVDIHNPNYNPAIPYSLRRQCSIVTKNDSGLYYNLSLQQRIRSNNGETAPCFCYGQTAYSKKFTHWYNADHELEYSGINFRHIRLADVYLMYAEAILREQGDAAVDEAIEYIDAVRSRAGVLTLEHYRSHFGQIPQLYKTTLDGSPRTWTNINAQSLLTHIMRVERPLELCFEGHRWYDLRRWGIIHEVLQDASDLEEWLMDHYSYENSEPFTPLGIIDHVRGDAQQALENYNPELHNYLPLPI